MELVAGLYHCSALNAGHNKALDAEPLIASFLKSMLIGGGPSTRPFCQETKNENRQFSTLLSV